MTSTPAVLDSEIINSIFGPCTDHESRMINVTGSLATIGDDAVRVTVEATGVNEETGRAVLHQISNENVLIVVGSVRLTNNLGSFGFGKSC